MASQGPQLNTLHVAVAGAVAEVRLNRPECANAMNAELWQDLRNCFRWLDGAPAVRAVVLAGAGRNFCAGIDLAMLGQVAGEVAHADGARSRERLRRIILDLQDCLAAIERCRKPVLAAIHGACVGGGLDLATWCDMRYAAADAVFSVREIDLAMVADVGTLQRLPRLVGEGMARELAYTGRSVDAVEAERLGLVNRVFPTAESLWEGVRELAAAIAAKSPLAIRGVKEAMNYARDHTLADGLRQVAAWNAAMLLSDDLQEALAARREGRPPRYPDE